jgi:RHS repeat-associated protein
MKVFLKSALCIAVFCWVQLCIAQNSSVSFQDADQFGTYKESTLDLEVKVQGGSIKVWRDWFGAKGAWKFNSQHENLKLIDRVPSADYGGRLIALSIFRGGRLYRGKHFLTWERKRAPSQDPTLSRLIQQSIAGQPITSCRGGVDRREGFVVTQTGYKFITGEQHEWAEYNDDGRLLNFGLGDRRIGQALYDTQNRLRGYADDAGNQVITFLRDTKGRIDEITDYSGRTLTYNYDAQDRIEEVTTIDGKKVTYDYEGRHIATITKGEGSDSAKVTLTYFDDGTLQSYLDEAGRGAYYTYEYRKNDKIFIETKKLTGNKVIKSYHSLDGDALYIEENGVPIRRQVMLCEDTAVVDRHNRVTYIDKDQDGRTIQIIYPDRAKNSFEQSPQFWPNLNKPWNTPGDPWGIVKFQNSAGLTVRYVRDSGGRVTKAIEAAGTPSERIWIFTYDSKGNLTKRRLLLGTDPDDTKDTIDQWTYDQHGNVITYTNSTNGTWAFENDAQGNITKVTEPNGAVSTYQYTPSGKPFKISTPSGFVSEYNYSARDLLTSYQETYDQGKTALVQYQYDKTGLVTKITDPMGKEWRYEYDEAADRRAAIDPEGNRKAWEYLRDGRVSKETDESGVSVTYEYFDTSAPGDAAQFGSPFKPIVIENHPTLKRELNFDLRGNLEREIIRPTQGDTLITNFTFDSERRLTKTVFPDGKESSATYDVLGRTTSTSGTGWGTSTIEYKQVGREITLTNPLGGKYTQILDRNGDLLKEIREGGKEKQYEYDPQRRLLFVLNESTQKISFDYDSASRVTTQKLFPSANSQTPEDTHQFGYNFRGDKVSISNNAASMTFDVDALGRTTSSTTNFQAFTKSHSYSYLPSGRRATYTSPDGTQYRYEWEPNGQVRLVEIPNEGSITYRYNSRDWTKPDEIAFPGGLKQRYIYDDLERIKQIQAKDRYNTTHFDSVYSYNPNSYLFTQRQSTDGLYKYSWDNGERLTKYEYPNGSKEEYSYDELGNRSTVGQSQWVYSKEGAVESGGGVTYSYDSKGNRVTRSEGGGQSKYNYSVHDRLMSIEEPVGTTKARYTYNSLGQRVSKEVGGAKTYFYYTEDGLASEFDKDGALIRSYLYEPNREWQERLLAVRQGGQYFYSVADHLGTPQKLINKDATVGWGVQYQAYGLAAPTTELITNPLRFPGQYEDQESGLYQNFHRDYDPRVGAYATQDPIGVFQTGANRYGYVYGNPVHLVDPRGLSPDEDHDGIPDSLEIPHVDLLDPTRDNRDIDHDGRPDLPGVPLLGGAAPGRGGGVGGLKAPVPPSQIKLAENIPTGICIVGTNYSKFRPTQDLINPDIVEHYVLKLKQGDKIPAIEVVELPDGRRFILDGHHRHVAENLSGKSIPKNIVKNGGPVGMPDWIGTIFKRFNLEN